MPQFSLPSPFGHLTIFEEAGAITRLDWARGQTEPTPLLREAATQLDAYFIGARTGFDLPLKINAAPHVVRLCAELQNIPFGETRTYGELAKELGLPAQAIGQACGANPIPIIVPCHRVLGAASLGGFSGGTGIETKVALLKHENAAGLLI